MDVFKLNMAGGGTNCSFYIGNISHRDCNETRAQPDAETFPYDSLGAMHFIVAVIVVYGVAVIGVFIIGHFRRRGKHESRDLDKQAHRFLKQMPTVRVSLEKQRRLSSIHQLLPNGLSCADDKNRITTLGDDVLKYISIPILPNEERGKLTNERMHHNQETERELRYIGTINERPSSVVSWSDVIKEVDEVASDDLEDDVFMNSRERNSFGVDIYIKR